MDFKILTKLKQLFIIIIELNYMFKFNISKPTWWLLFIYATKNMSSLICHARTQLGYWLLELHIKSAANTLYCVTTQKQLHKKLMHLYVQLTP
jgi:hypothetical protein